MNRKLSCCSDLCSYSENECSVLLDKKGEFIFLLNIERLQLEKKKHCDVLLAKTEEGKEDITLYFIELKNTANTKNEKFTEVLSSIEQKTESFSEIEQKVKNLFPKHKDSGFSKQYIIFLSKNTINELKRSESLFKHLYELRNVKKNVHLDVIRFKCCNTTIFKDDCCYEIS